MAVPTATPAPTALPTATATPAPTAPPKIPGAWETPEPGEYWGFEWPTVNEPFIVSISASNGSITVTSDFDLSISGVQEFGVTFVWFGEVSRGTPFRYIDLLTGIEIEVVPAQPDVEQGTVMLTVTKIVVPDGFAVIRITGLITE